MPIRQLPWTFVVVVAMSIALTIFFGAWAVSADIEGRYDELLPPQAQGTGPLPGAASPLDAGQEKGGGEWWESGLLFACPFH